MSEYEDREVVERARYLAAIADIDLTTDQAVALAYRERGYAHDAIARILDTAPSTVTAWLGRVAARYGLAAIETKTEAERGGLKPMTVDRLDPLAPPVVKQYRAYAVDHADVVPSAVAEALALGEGGIDA